jgi:hypothetical protein
MASLRESVEEPKGTTRKKSRQGTGAVPRHRSRANPDCTSESPAAPLAGLFSFVEGLRC